MENSWTQDELAEAIEEKTKDVWEKNRNPLLLSELGMELSKQKGDYRSAIAPLKLRQFIATQLSSRVVIITHPTQQQKIALIPSGEQFSFDDTTQRSTNKTNESERIKASIWAAFVKPIPANSTRYLDIAGQELRFQDVPSNSPPPSQTSKQIPSGLVIDGRSSKYDAQEVADTIKTWASKNNLPEEKLYIRELKTRPPKNKFFEVFQGLSESDLRRIQIPFDIIMKLAQK
ncbi:hypothetical protein [Roseibium aggregatum]|uniref:Uncharacterized protein n=1 Tax=Roseibium aggregatum TaxID=187304 RepID=A0A939EH87_9HYPH|nr:hypothetical protein [Roseibium aggregatum]MBN9671499.1 hypothetical protein [Roseibium aggregatum]